MPFKDGDMTTFQKIVKCSRSVYLFERSDDRPKFRPVFFINIVSHVQTPSTSVNFFPHDTLYL